MINFKTFYEEHNDEIWDNFKNIEIEFRQLNDLNKFQTGEFFSKFLKIIFERETSIYNNKLLLYGNEFTTTFLIKLIYKYINNFKLDFLNLLLTNSNLYEEFKNWSVSQINTTTNNDSYKGLTTDGVFSKNESKNSNEIFGPQTFLKEFDFNTSINLLDFHNDINNLFISMEVY